MKSVIELVTNMLELYVNCAYFKVYKEIREVSFNSLSLFITTYLVVGKPNLIFWCIV